LTLLEQPVNRIGVFAQRSIYGTLPHEMVEEGKLDVRPEAGDKEGARIPGFSQPRHRFWRYGPLIIWAALIFIGSSNLLSASNTSMFLLRPLHWLLPQASDTTLRVLHLIARKAGHLTEYAILALLAARAFRTSSRELLRSRWFWASLFLVIAYSLTDEFHQSFIPSRTASIYDSMIDSIGGLTALAVLVFRTLRKHGQNLHD
jgi:VanZ family protein